MRSVLLLFTPRYITWSLSVLATLRLVRIMRPCHGRSLLWLIVVHHRATERTEIRHARAAACR